MRPRRAAGRRVGGVRRASGSGRRRAAPWPRSTPPSCRGSRGGPAIRFVNAAAANRTPSTRCSSSACEETSIAHGAVARVEHAAGTCAAGRSPRASSARPARPTPPTRCSIVPSSPHGRRPPRGSRASRRPSWSCRSCRSRPPPAACGWARRRTASASGAIALARVGHHRPAARRPRAAARTTSATAPAATAAAACVVAVDGRPGHADEQRTGHDAARVVGEVGDLHAVPPFRTARTSRASNRWSSSTGGV